MSTKFRRIAVLEVTALGRWAVVPVEPSGPAAAGAGVSRGTSTSAPGRHAGRMTASRRRRAAAPPMAR